MRSQALSEKTAVLKQYDAGLRECMDAQVLVGVDEAGRGPLAGPVFAAAVAFGPDAEIDCVFDSKRLGEKQRESSYLRIADECLYFAVACASASEIDTLNIREASLLAMRRAVSMLPFGEYLVVVDGKDALGHNLNSRAIVGGDGLSLSIAAASILAKVARDSYMRSLDEEFPVYGFAVNKGYPTPYHLRVIREMGPCREHRLSFRGVMTDSLERKSCYGGS